MILLPGDPEFEFVMDNMPPPPNWRSHDPHGETALIQDPDTGCWRAANQKEFMEAVFESGDLYFPDSA